MVTYELLMPIGLKDDKVEILERMIAMKMREHIHNRSIAENSDSGIISNDESMMKQKEP
jgi:hypothetical protein